MQLGRRKQIWYATALVAIVLLAHGPSLWGAFIWDDLNLITRSPLIHASDGLYRYWFTTQAPDYFPLTSTTWWIEWRVWGAHPAGYHLVNLLLHAASSILIWQILAELSLPGAWLAAAIWAVHPVQVESVAWIAERKNTLSLALAAASMLLFLRYLRTNRPSIFVAAIAAFIAALLAKTAVAPLPLMMLAAGVWRGRPIRRALTETIPFIVAAVALSAVTIYFQSQRSISNDIVRTDGVASRIAIAAKAIWFYLGKLIWPVPLDFVYPRWHTGDASLTAFIPLLLLVLLFGVLWRSRAWGAIAAMGYFIIMLLPVLGLINIYFMRYSLVADHWQYAASIGPIALFAAAVSRAKLQFQWAISAVVLTLLVIASERQSILYRSAESIWRDTIAKNPASWMPQMNLGHTLAEDGRYDEAKTHYRVASSLAPDLAEPYYSLGTVDAEQGHHSQAVEEYENAIGRNSDVADIHLDMGHSLEVLGRSVEAVSEYGKAVTLQPDWTRARMVLAHALLDTGQRAAAADQYEQVLRIDPGSMAARVGLQAARGAQ